MVNPDELPTWVVHQDEDVLVLNKPGWLVCHPAKRGPWSALVSACREWLDVKRLHLVARLDRETSGVVLMAMHKRAANQYQSALEQRRVAKVYVTVLEGELHEPALVKRAIGRDPDSPVFVKRRLVDSVDAEAAVTEFVPLAVKNGFTLALAKPLTGRTHQIRLHARALGMWVVGDKLYGPDERLYLRFVEEGWIAEMEAPLKLSRQALHCWRMTFRLEGYNRAFTAAVPEDLSRFIETNMSLSAEAVHNLVEAQLESVEDAEA